MTWLQKFGRAILHDQMAKYTISLLCGYENSRYATLLFSNHLISGLSCGTSRALCHLGRYRSRAFGELPVRPLLAVSRWGWG